MPPIERPLSGAVLLYDLNEEGSRSADPTLLERSGRSARTLLKEGPLRVTLITLAAGGEIRKHRAQGPITLQPLEGRIRFHTLGKTYEIGPGELLSAGPGVPHSVRSEEGGVFLLTLALPGDEG